MNKEIWIDIIGYESLYKVSSLGRVKSLKRKNVKNDRILKPCIRAGYLKVSLNKNAKKKSFKVHQLVAMVFLNHTPNGREIVVDHINEVKTDNRVENLQIINHRENISKSKNRNTTSKYTGVHFHKQRKKWEAKIWIKSKPIYLGLYKTEIEAHNAYISYCIQNNITNRYKK
ncbi:NUMOD4 domain-containing protein [Thalassobellus suaedae]|uniref:NUMOD4 domain-containing protein n=1 Tax=Thalassobellus suaedae TaxID=3074124 RepID=A0ABY9XVT8_9FLAO|nr:NUMOD4 domain-containing protein [Flavobacteriaceae bacterium HL-DH14]